MRVLMVGAGATGGYFGAKLAQAGRDITFLVREKRAAQLRQRGLEVFSPHGDFTLKPSLITADELREQSTSFDLIIISTKSYQLENAMEDIAPVVGPTTMLLPILNGMRQHAVLDERFGAEKVLGGSVRIVADMDDDGRVHQKTKLGEISYGERSGERTPRIQAVNRVLQDAGFEANLQPDILATLWQKWWILASLGSICVLARGAVGEVAAAPLGLQFAGAVVKECTDIAIANGYTPEPAMLAYHRERMVELGSALTSSMYRDMMKGAQVEADHILGDLLARAKGVATPLLMAAYVQLKVYEAERTRR